MTRSRLRLALAAGVALTVAAAAAVYFSRLAEPDRPLGERVATADGRLGFTAPAGWHQSACPSGSSDCVQVSPSEAGSGDVVSVLIAQPNTVEGNPADVLLMTDTPLDLDGIAGFDRLTVAGAAAVRIDTAKMPDAGGETGVPGIDRTRIIWYGAVPGTADPFC